MAWEKQWNSVVVPGPGNGRAGAGALGVAGGGACGTERRLALVLAVMVAWCAGALAGAQGEATVNLSRMKIKGFVLAIPSENGPDTIAMVRAKTAYGSLQRRAFYRIGLLPMWIGEEVVVEFPNPQAVTNALAGLTHSLQSQAKGASIELRQVEFRFPGEAVPRLKAARVRLVNDSQCQMSEAVLQRGGQQLRAANATLQLSGEHAGRLTWPLAGGDSPGNLFTLQPATNCPATTSKSL